MYNVSHADVVVGLSTDQDDEVGSPVVPHSSHPPPQPPILARPRYSQHHSVSTALLHSVGPSPSPDISLHSTLVQDTGACTSIPVGLSVADGVRPPARTPSCQQLHLPKDVSPDRVGAAMQVYVALVRAEPRRVASCDEAAICPCWPRSCTTGRGTGRARTRVGWMGCTWGSTYSAVRASCRRRYFRTRARSLMLPPAGTGPHRQLHPRHRAAHLPLPRPALPPSARLPPALPPRGVPIRPQCGVRAHQPAQGHPAPAAALGGGQT